MSHLTDWLIKYNLLDIKQVLIDANVSSINDLKLIHNNDNKKQVLIAVYQHFHTNITNYKIANRRLTYFQFCLKQDFGNFMQDFNTNEFKQHILTITADINCYNDYFNCITSLLNVINLKGTNYEPPINDILIITAWWGKPNDPNFKQNYDKSLLTIRLNFILSILVDLMEYFKQRKTIVTDIISNYDNFKGVFLGFC